MSGPTRPGFALAVRGRAGRRVCRRAADFGRERGFEQAREVAVVAVREFVGRVQAGEEEFVFAVAVDYQVVHDVVQGVVEEALGDLRQSWGPVGGGHCWGCWPRREGVGGGRARFCSRLCSFLHVAARFAMSLVLEWMQMGKQARKREIVSTQMIRGKSYALELK